MGARPGPGPGARGDVIGGRFMASGEHLAIRPETAEGWRGDMTGHVFIYDGPDILLRKGTPIEVESVTCSVRGWETSPESASPCWSAARIWFRPLRRWFVRACRVTIAGVRVGPAAPVEPGGGPGMPDD